MLLYIQYTSAAKPHRHSRRIRTSGTRGTDRRQFQVLFYEAQGAASTDGEYWHIHNSSHDVSGDGACGIAVAAVIYRSNERLGKIILIFQAAIKGNGQCFLDDPALSERKQIFSSGRVFFDSSTALSMADRRRRR